VWLNAQVTKCVIPFFIFAKLEENKGNYRRRVIAYMCKNVDCKGNTDLDNKEKLCTGIDALTNIFIQCMWFWIMSTRFS
jgi:hypothetical protein